MSSSARLLGVFTPLHFARLDLLVPSNSLKRLQNLHRMLGVGQISCTFNPSNGAYSYGALRHFFNLDPHNSATSSERFSNPPVLSVGRAVTTGIEKHRSWMRVDHERTNNHVRSLDRWLGRHVVHLPLSWCSGLGWVPLLSCLSWSLRCWWSWWQVLLWTTFGIMTFLPALVALAVVVNGATWLTSLWT